MTRRWRLRWAELTSRFHGSPNPYYLRQIERRGALTDEDLQQLRTAIPTDGPGRAAYLKTLRLWGIEHHVDFGLHVEDELGEVGRSLVMRYHIIDRRMAYEAPRHAAMESYVEPGGWINFRQHPWEPSGVLPVPSDPEAAWADFIEWCRDGPYHRAEPLLRKETYLRIFTEDKPYHVWELRQPSEPEHNGSQ